jgi:glycosyltransferase involved in cell wall biosynthesis
MYFPSQSGEETTAMRSLRQLLGPRLGVHRQYPPRPVLLRRPDVGLSPPPEWPCIAIVTPSFNQGRFLERTLRSVLDQQYPKLEYVVQDGGSSDESLEVIRRYAPRLTSSESCADRGQAHALNLGFARTTGAIMAYLNADDILLPGTLATVGRFFAKHPEVDVVYGHRVLIDEWDREIGRWVLPPHEDLALTWNDYIPQETLFWRRSLWDAAGSSFDESFHYALDWDLLLRFRRTRAQFLRLPHFLGAFRVHASQKSVVHVSTIGLQEARRLQRRLHGRPVSRWEARFRVAPYLCKHLAFDWLYRCGFGT